MNSTKLSLRIGGEGLTPWSPQWM